MKIGTIWKRRSEGWGRGEKWMPGNKGRKTEGGV